jgi:hypothetical protein
MAKRDDSEVKTCTVCEEEKTISSFWKTSKQRKDGTFGYRSVCIDCSIKEKLEKYHNENGKEIQKQRSFKALLKKYGISEQEYEAERIKQNYSCKLCGDHESNQPHKRLHIDHCHETGKYRGLLCNKCNLGLGAFKDNVDVLKQAIEYLNENRS